VLVLGAGITLRVQEPGFLKPSGPKLGQEGAALLCSSNSGKPIKLKSI
jgi:hypothetical protein